MANVEISNYGVEELRSTTTAAGGTALSTTTTYIQFPRGTRRIFAAFRNYDGATVSQICFSPFLIVLKSINGMTSVPIDYSWNAQDASTSGAPVSLNALPTLANGGLLLVGSHLPFAGVYVDVDSANAIASALTVSYWNGLVWTDISATDNTGGATTMANDGTVTWTVPTAWKTASLDKLYAGNIDSPYPYKTDKLYWTRWVVAAALTDPTTVDAMTAINRSTAYSEWLSGQTLEMDVQHGPSGIGGIQALTNAGTANLIVNVATNPSGRFS